MNQILNINLNKDIDDSSFNDYKKNDKKKIFKIQFILSILAIIIFTSLYVYYKIKLNQRERFSNSLINNYNISKLYSPKSSYQTNQIQNNIVIGIIEIPKLNIFYPIFSELDDELLKICPCRFYGEMPDANSNLCIAGHNYDNDKFFSHISFLKNGDKINIYNNEGKKFDYTVIKNYEVKENDFSPIYQKLSNSYEITLITCNNLNNNRTVIKAFKTQ